MNQANDCWGFMPLCQVSIVAAYLKPYVLIQHDRLESMACDIFYEGTTMRMDSVDKK